MACRDRPGEKIIPVCFYEAVPGKQSFPYNFHAKKKDQKKLWLPTVSFNRLSKRLIICGRSP
jgi:hypothetical protein